MERSYWKYKCNNCKHTSTYSRNAFGGDLQYDDKERPRVTHIDMSVELAGPSKNGTMERTGKADLYICPKCHVLQAVGYTGVHKRGGKKKASA